MIHLIGHLLEGGYRAWSFLRLLDYLSVRAIGAAMSAFILVLVVMPRFMWYLHRRGLVDQMRETGVPSSFDKAGTPAMGGAVMVGALVAACFVWCDLANLYVWAVLAATLWFAAIGLSDDVAKWRSRSGNRGMSEARKLLLQGAFAALFAALLASPWTPLPAREASTLYVPFVKQALSASWWVYLPVVFGFIVLVGNAVNITDGLDGLAIVPSALRRVRRSASLRGSWATRSGPSTCSSRCCLASANWWSCARRSRARPSGFCGSTPTRRRCSWATRGRWPSAASSRRCPCW